MTKAILAVLVLTLTCLLALSAARPSVLNQEVSLKTEPNVPRTFLGKPYRQRRDVQGCSRPCCTLAITDRNDSHADADADADADVSTQQTVPVTCPLCVQNSDAIALVGHDHVSAHGTLTDNDGRTKTNADTELRGTLAPPVVVNSSPESGSARSRLMKSKQASRLRNGPDVPLSSEVRSDGMSLTEKDAERVQPRVVSTQSTRQVAFAVGRWKRLYDRGEWKSRLLEEY